MATEENFVNEKEFYTIQHVLIGKVLPNPLNPRKNNSIKTHEIQEIISKRGWEEPVTAYPKNGNYILLAGHRRRFAAKKMNEETMPVYVVPPPADENEERERIASLQSGRVDWSPFEWAQYVKDMYEAWNRPPMNKFSRALNMNSMKTKQYIDVLNYFPRPEIETPLTTKAVAISTLDSIVRFMKALKKFKPELIETLGEDLIRKTMLEKAITGKAQRDDLRNTEYVEKVAVEKLQEFIVDPEAELHAEIGWLGIQKKYKSFTGHLISLGHFEKRIPHIKPETELQKESAIEALEKLIKQASEQLESIKK
ncbi:ParB/RepB/Spo0J family partition protein [Peribacillus frigoritolerans]|uniref:ParB/RepB/Spo0J family partition protein n=1 Tax=Peribacillus castrilensis TaxID=2897690 RepID=A0AAW9NHQ9_9BACI|nr:ParB/RepB/Spo0J family partition protein [Peribacillus castrilensis]